MEYLLEHLEQWKSFYDEVIAETLRAANMNEDGVRSMEKGSEVRPTRVRRRPARFKEASVYLSQEHK